MPSRFYPILAREAGPVVAADYAGRFERAIERILVFPESGSPRSALAARIAIVAPYVVFYDHDMQADEVTLLRILHGRREITSAMIRSP
jgi:toxin ParE1/3/4